ncbi:hypothetical protein A2U01_0076511, partial [Trifolium medium]|nr:hypothetical protein [Trifolium medium]
MFHRCKVLLCVDCNEELAKLLIRELRSIICDHKLWNPKPSKYISLEEVEHLERRYIGEGLCFHPFGEVIDSDDK